jgi:hypothetical protein
MKTQYVHGADTRSAKPLCVGSIPTRASNNRQLRVNSFYSDYEEIFFRLLSRSHPDDFLTVKHPFGFEIGVL